MNNFCLTQNILFIEFPSPISPFFRFKLFYSLALISDKSALESENGFAANKAEDILKVLKVEFENGTMSQSLPKEKSFILSLPYKIPWFSIQKLAMNYAQFAVG